MPARTSVNSDRDMHCLATSTTVLVAFAGLLSVATCHLSCDSQLRLLPQFADLFTHCECGYSEWSEWTALRVTEVPTSQCESGKALTEERNRTVVDYSTNDCNETTEERTVCKSSLNKFARIA